MPPPAWLRLLLEAYDRASVDRLAPVSMLRSFKRVRLVTEPSSPSTLGSISTWCVHFSLLRSKSVNIGNVKRVGAFIALSLGGSAAFADTAEVSFVRLSGSVAQGTAVFRADLSELSFADFSSITLVDSNSMTGGSSGQYSGFDLDAIKVSSTFATTAAQASAAAGLNVFDFSPTATLFTPGTQRTPADIKLNGTDNSGLNVDNAWATLSAFDAIFFGTGSVTLGDGGRVAFNLISAAPTLDRYIYIGEVSGDAGENIAGSLLVSTSPVPEPGVWAMFLAGLGTLSFRFRRSFRVLLS